MYGVPADLDLSLFLGKEIGVVNLGQYMFNLDFGEEGLWISCEGEVVVVKDAQPKTVRNSEWVDLSPLVAIQNISVSDWKIESGISFSLTLADSTKIIFTEFSKMYESFEISFGARTLII